MQRLCFYLNGIFYLPLFLWDCRLLLWNSYKEVNLFRKSLSKRSRNPILSSCQYKAVVQSRVRDRETVIHSPSISGYIPIYIPGLVAAWEISCRIGALSIWIGTLGSSNNVFWYRPSRSEKIVLFIASLIYSVGVVGFRVFFFRHKLACARFIRHSVLLAGLLFWDAVVIVSLSSL